VSVPAGGGGVVPRGGPAMGSLKEASRALAGLEALP
jgi:hypothetical protein